MAGGWAGAKPQFALRRGQSPADTRAVRRVPILAALVGFGAYRPAGERAKPSPVATVAVAKATAELFTYAAREPK
jgi:hypothetical protein